MKMNFKVINPKGEVLRYFENANDAFMYLLSFDKYCILAAKGYKVCSVNKGKRNVK